ncbi:hypothetical protein NG819_15190 [Pseudarthrobacter sp. Fe7]|nr:hypothetical protein NG819_15190 [Pseudarthrobacter sp. Fe7]
MNNRFRSAAALAGILTVVPLIFALSGCSAGSPTAAAAPSPAASNAPASAAPTSKSVDLPATLKLEPFMTNAPADPQQHQLYLAQMYARAMSETQYGLSGRYAQAGSPTQAVSILFDNVFSQALKDRISISHEGFDNPAAAAADPSQITFPFISVKEDAATTFDKRCVAEKSPYCSLTNSNNSNASLDVDYMDQATVDQSQPDRVKFQWHAYIPLQEKATGAEAYGEMTVGINVSFVPNPDKASPIHYLIDTVHNDTGTGAEVHPLEGKAKFWSAIAGKTID